MVDSFFFLAVEVSCLDDSLLSRILGLEVPVAFIFSFICVVLILAFSFLNDADLVDYLRDVLLNFSLPVILTPLRMDGDPQLAYEST